MQLSHLRKKDNPAQLGEKSLRALSTPITVRRRNRQTYLDPMQMHGSIDNTLALPDPTGSWRVLETQRKHLLNLPYSNLATLALDLSPQLNKGLWDFVRFGNPGYVVRDKDENETAVMAAKDFIKMTGCYYGNFKNHLDSMWSNIFVYGSLFTELVLDHGATRAVDIAINNSLSVRYRLRDDAVRGQSFELGQQQRHGFVSLEDNELVRYIGFDRLGNNPYGRPLIAPAVHASLFLLGLVQDLRRVIANQGLSRIDYSLDAEEILRLIDRNPEIAGDDAATAQFITDQIESIKEVLSGLEVDQDYVHLSTVAVNYATSPIQTNMNGLDTLVNNLQRDVINGMRSISILSNLLDSTTETHGTVQLEYYVSAIQSIQEEVAMLISDYLNIHNQVMGLRSNIEFSFKKQRTADRMQVAQTESLETETVLKKLESGVISVDEARMELDKIRDELIIA